jgi:hypothetical protein
MKINIHNQCPNFKLTNQKNFIASTEWIKEPNVEVDAGSMTSADLKSYLATFEGGLTYQLQRKHVESDDQLESTHTLLCITLKYEGYRMLCACVRLIEYDKQIMWNEYKLREYYQRYANQFGIYNGPIEDIWLTCDDTMLMTRLELDFTQSNSVLNIIISEGIRYGCTKKPEWINPER